MEECAVCYEKTANCKLVCGHKFCKACVKTWYLKGSESSCPMCRKRIHYRRMPINKWKNEAEENKKQQVFEESFDNLIEAIMEPLVFQATETIPEIETPGFIQRFDGRILTLHRTNMPMYDLADLQSTFRAIKDDVNVDEIDYVLNDTDAYYSDRHINLRKRTYSENGHMYKIQNKQFKNKPRRY